MGSGGGGVWNGGGSTHGPGGNGGGIIYIGASDITVEAAQGILAEGETTFHWSQGSYTYGAAGGAGGSIFLLADSLTLATSAISAIGGEGQDDYIRHGGDGGDGRIRLDFANINGMEFGTIDAELLVNEVSQPIAGDTQLLE